MPSISYLPQEQYRNAMQEAEAALAEALRQCRAQGASGVRGASSCARRSPERT
jgi:Tfp pilus assembly protein PilX